MSTATSSWPLERVDPASVGLCPERLARIGELVRRYVDEGRIAGAIALVARRGGIAHLECIGLADLEALADGDDRWNVGWVGRHLFFPLAPVWSELCSESRTFRPSGQ